MESNGFWNSEDMRAMVLNRVGEELKLREVPKPVPQKGEVLLRVLVCGVCRTDLHIFDGELGEPKLPLIMGHQVVGVVEELGEGAGRFEVGERVGVPWLGGACEVCRYCVSGRENLCDEPVFTGYQKDGGYAEYVVADERFCLKVPSGYTDEHLAPLLCAGLIGYRAYRMMGEVEDVGFYGFGASAHILIQLANYEGKRVHVFTRPGDVEGQAFANKMGAHWVGGSDEVLEETLDGAIIFAPVGALVPQALRSMRKGGVVVCAGIHMSDIPQFEYKLLWNERRVCSVANLTREDGREFMEVVPKVPIRTTVKVYKLEEANEALECLREGGVRGAIVLRVSG